MRSGYLKGVVDALNSTSIRSLRTYRILQFGPLLQSFYVRTMATSSKVKLSVSQHPEFFVPGITSESADTASELLQENHDQHHIFFNKSGFHVCELT